MKKNVLWKVVILLGIIPFVVPFGAAIWNIYLIHSHPGWTVFEFVFLYSFLYWPTYIAGLAAVCSGFYGLRKNK